MDAVLIIAAVAAIALGAPYIGFLVKRLIAVNKIKKSCAVNGYKFHRARRFVAISRRGSGKCDFYLEKPDEILAVKLFGDPRRGRELIICPENEYFYRRINIFFSFGSIFRFGTDLPRRTMPEYNFRFRYKEEWRTKRARDVLLVHPCSGEVCFLPLHGGERRIAGGEPIRGVEILRLPDIIKGGVSLIQ